MKLIFSLLFILIAAASCDTTRSITANPDDHTSTSGTLGSAKMTTALPDQDSARVQKDSLHHQR